MVNETLLATTTAQVPQIQFSSNDFFATIIAATSLFGIFTNTYAMYILYNSGKIGMSFQQLCFSLCISNNLDLLLFLFFCAPTTLFKLRDFTQNTYIARLLGACMTFAWNVSVYSHLMISFNRLLVITWPIQSRNYINQRASTIMIASVWIFSAINYIPYTYVPKCYMLFDTELYFFTYPSNDCAHMLSNIQYWGGIVSSGLVILFDTWTLIRLITYKMSRGSQLHASDIRFFIQAVLQGILFLNALTFFFVISGYFNTPVNPNYTALFFTNTFIWQITQSMDAFILIPFHFKDYRKRQRQLEKESFTTPTSSVVRIVPQQSSPRR